MFVVEVITVLARQRSHLRVTRALRPVFFLDNVLMDGVRRYAIIIVDDALAGIRFFIHNINFYSSPFIIIHRGLRDISISLKPIIDVLFLLLFVVLMFSLLGKLKDLRA